jgi:hypothetical protein
MNPFGLDSAWDLDGNGFWRDPLSGYILSVNAGKNKIIF